MQSELKQKVLELVQNDYNGDVKKFISDVEKVWEENQQSDQNRIHKQKVISENMKVAVSLRNVSKSYGKGANRIKVLKDIDFDIYESEIIALVGPSGSGKSTLLNIIGGLDTPDEGEVQSFGKDLKSLNDDQRSYYRNCDVGFVFQFFYLQPYLTVQDNVAIPLIFQNVNVAERSTRSQQILDQVGLQDKSKALPSELSGGQMQRVAIARAVVNNPKIIIADEPTGNLDRTNATIIMDLLRKINETQKTTILIVTHDMFVAEKCDRIIHITDGKIN